MVAVSQSGETADTLAAIRDARIKGGKVFGITNVVGSPVARESDGVIYTKANKEIAVASTKSFIGQIVKPVAGFRFRWRRPKARSKPVR